MVRIAIALFAIIVVAPVAVPRCVARVAVAAAAPHAICPFLYALFLPSLNHVYHLVIFLVLPDRLVVVHAAPTLAACAQQQRPFVEQVFDSVVVVIIGGDFRTTAAGCLRFGRGITSVLQKPVAPQAFGIVVVVVGREGRGRGGGGGGGENAGTKDDFNLVKETFFMKVWLLFFCVAAL